MGSLVKIVVKLTWFHLSICLCWLYGRFHCIISYFFIIWNV